MKQYLQRFALVAMAVCAPMAAQAQCISLTAIDAPAAQGFNALSATATSTTNTLSLAGWYLTETGSGARVNGQYAVDTGSGTSGDTYSYGSAGNSDRALGTLRSSSLVPVFGACFTNNTGTAINSLDVGYTGEQWRLGTAARTDRLDFQYGLGATSLVNGNWTDVNELDFSTPNTTTTGAKDGNASGNRLALATTIALAGPVANGDTFWVRWTDLDASGADDGLAIDDFSLVPRAGGGGTPPPAVTIAQLQGPGQRSPFFDQQVVTEGVVTALKFNNGFFLQTPDAEADGDAATSEAVFVFTSSAPTAAVGDRVRVTATVREFVPGANQNQLPITELVSPSIQRLASGLPLPIAVALTAADLGAASQPDTLERLEGMRVAVAEARVVEASDGRIDENDALSSTGGVFQVVLPAVARPFREPGIGILDAIVIPAGKSPPRFDTNQERLMVRSWGQVGSTPLAVDVDASVTGLVGVLDYSNGTWALTPDRAAAIGVSGGKSPVAVSEALDREVTIGSFNLLRFFDDVADGNGAVKLTTVAIEARLAKTASAICDWLKAPDILGVVEVENLNVLGKLADRINTTCPRAPAYVPYLEQGNDVGGINVGFLVSRRDNGAGQPRVAVGEVVQFGKEATLANPDGSTSILNDRPPLLLRATVQNANGGNYPLSVIVNHLRSLNDIDSTASGSSGWSTSGERVRAKRAAQAAYLAGLVNSLQEAAPAQQMVLVGDFNAFEFNDGYVDVMGIVRGTPAPFDQVLTWAPSPVTTPLVDGSELIHDPSERYSYVYAGNAQTLDHVLVNEALLLAAANARVEHARINADFGVHHFGEAGNALRVSDHDPVRLSIEPPQFRDADLSVAIQGPAKKLHYGRTERFPMRVANAGPLAAWRPTVVLSGDAPAANVRIAAPDGWTCATTGTAIGFELRCSSDVPLHSGATVAFEPEILVPARPDSTEFLTLDVLVGAQSRDPALGNNTARYRNRIVGVP